MPSKGIILFRGPREEVQLPNMSRRLPAALRSLRHLSEKETSTPCLGESFQPKRQDPHTTSHVTLPISLVSPFTIFSPEAIRQSSRRCLRSLVHQSFYVMQNYAQITIFPCGLDFLKARMLSHSGFNNRIQTSTWPMRDETFNEQVNGPDLSNRQQVLQYDLPKCYMTGQIQLCSIWVRAVCSVWTQHRTRFSKHCQGTGQNCADVRCFSRNHSTGKTIAGWGNSINSCL